MPEALQRRAIASIHLDAVGGAAGDMFVACMLDAFPELAADVMRDIGAVLPPQAGRPYLEAGASNGIRAMRFGLESAAADTHRLEHRENPGHAHGHDHHHDDPRHHHHDVGGHPAHATYNALTKLIQDSALGVDAKHHAVAILTLLAEAEAQMHGVPISDVHFHELADWDSLMDVVAAGSILAALGPVRWSVSTLPLGSGLVNTQHGLLPVPAPATALLLRGFAMRDDGIPGERVTPTGAAILAHLIDPATLHDPQPGGRLSRTGIGAGSRQMKGMPNILRALVFEEDADSVADIVEIIEFEVDDMTGEEIGVAAEHLRKVDGVLDVSTAARMGKKGRPMTEFRLLCAHGHVAAVADACFLQTSTIGLRMRRETRRILDRKHVAVGDMQVKEVSRPAQVITRKAESDDLARLDTLAERRRAAAELELKR